MHKSSEHSDKDCVWNEDAPTVISCAHLKDKRSLWPSSPQALFVFRRPMPRRKGVQMKNYQKLYYKHYYAQNENGEYIPVSRKACFAPAEPPTEDKPYKQRWFYDPEAGYAVRLERNKQNEDIHRLNDTSLKKEERYRDRKFSCVWKDTSNCNQDCIKCIRKNTCRTVELDKTWANENSDEMKSIFDPIDETQSIAEILEDKELFSALASALEKLSAKDMELFYCLMYKEQKKVIAEKLNITVDGVRYRELQLRKKLLSNKDLKDFLKK